MFHPSTSTLHSLSHLERHRINELESLFSGLTYVYIDFANVKPWSNKLGWHIDPKRLKQFLNSFSNVGRTSFYYGEVQGNNDSVKFLRDVTKCGYRLVTKPVKKVIIPLTEKYNVDSRSSEIAENFIHKNLLPKLSKRFVRDFHQQLDELDQSGMHYIADYKCNFDVEITWDLVHDLYTEPVQTFIIWSGDADFEFPIRKLQAAGKNVIIFATSRRVSRELSQCGVKIYDIQKIRNFICWNKEVDKKAKETTKVSQLKKY